MQESSDFGAKKKTGLEAEGEENLPALS